MSTGGVTRAAVLGAGSWGTTVAALLAPVVPTVLWSRRPDVAADVAAGRGNRRYLEGYSLPRSLDATDDLAAAVDGADLVVVGVPTEGFRWALCQAAPHVGDGVPVVSLAKGFEQGTGLRMSEVAAEVLPGRPVGVLTGPNLAREILEGRSAATVVASTDPDTAVTLQGLLATDRLRVYTNDDLVGCELGGALKNVIALAAGLAEGLETGDNARAALITRGLAEMTRLGVALGGDPMTLAGLAGLGCRMRPIFTSAWPSISRAFFSANPPTATSHSGCKIATTLTKCALQISSSGLASPAGSLSGVRFRPVSSRKANGQ